MTRDEAKRYIQTQEPTFLKRAKSDVNGMSSWICPNPNCRNGSGENGTGICIVLNPDRSIKIPYHYKCFKCGLYGDVIDLWKSDKNITDDTEAFNEVYNYYGVKIDNMNEKPNKSKSFQDYYNKCSSNFNNKLKSIRGISEKTCQYFRLGYEENFHTKTKKSGTEEYTTWKALIIPVSQTGAYSVRNLDETAGKDDRYRKRGNGSTLFNTKNMYKSENGIFVTEGELDAISIFDVGGYAIALRSTENENKLIELFKEKKPTQPVIIALDNDSDGIKTADQLEKDLQELGIYYYRPENLFGECKDANELLQKDRQALHTAVENTLKAIQEDETQEEENQKEEYLNTSAGSHLQEFLDGIADSVNTPCISTGFKNLDEALDGGLYEGLYTLGAITALGKSTVCLQICDQVARNENTVLYISLEMARTELMAKSISRLTAINAKENGISMNNAKTMRGISDGKRYSNYNDQERKLINESVKQYGEYASNIYIHEGVGNIGVQQIREIVKNHIHFTGEKPVLIVDYLQILAPYDVRATDKQNTDRSVIELKRISRDFKIPVIAISSFNRQNYNGEVNMTAYKESGAIEYSSDCLLGLQFVGADSKEFDTEKSMEQTERDVEIVVLKNRNGQSRKKAEFTYYTMFNYYEEKNEWN